MKKENVVAGFWLKLAIKLIDFILVASISIALSFLILKNKGGWKFKYDWLFYMWCIEVIILFALFFLVIPIISNGKTIGNYITKTKIIENNNKIVWGILKKEVFFAWSWMFLTFLVMVVVNHTLIIKYALLNTKITTFTEWENLRIGVVSSIGSLLIFTQMIIGISVLVRKDKRSLADIYANTKTIRENKFMEIPPNRNIIKKIKPKFIKNHIVEWI